MEGRKRVGIGMLGAGWMGRAHTNAYKTAQYMFWPESRWTIDLVGIGGIDEKEGKEAAERYGYAHGYAGYEKLISDSDIDIFDNVAPDTVHVIPTIAAAGAGKNVVCEKPIALNSRDAKAMLDAAESAAVKHMSGFCYRFIPAVRLAYELIRNCVLGKVYHFSGTYYQDQGSFEDTPIEKVWYIMGSGVDQGIATHMIDMARFLVGEIGTVFGQSKTYNTRRPSKSGMVDVDAVEGFFSLFEFISGPTGVIQTLGVANGKQSEFSFEIFGSKGSMRWDMADPNILYVYLSDTVNPKVLGWTRVCVTEANHPFMDIWWPKGHVLGWEHGHINMLAHFVDCVANDKDIAPLGGTFEDGYKVAVIIDAIHQSSLEGRKVLIEY
jgi:predicted dehydrogenase